MKSGLQRAERLQIMLTAPLHPLYTAMISRSMVPLACDLCPRQVQYRQETLIERFGGDVLMPDVRHLIAQPKNDSSLKR